MGGDNSGDNSGGTGGDNLGGDNSGGGTGGDNSGGVGPDNGPGPSGPGPGGPSPGGGGLGKAATAGVVVGAIGGLTLVAAGGKVLWKKRRRAPRPVSDAIPPQCVAQAEAYEGSRERLLTLRQAASDLGEQLRRAEIIHANNIMKARMAVGYEIGTAVGAPIGDATRAWARPRGLDAVPTQVDTWTPPATGITARLANALQTATEALQVVRNRVQQLTSKIGELTESLSERIANSPVVQDAQELLRDAIARRTRAEQCLPKAEAARQGVEEAEKWLESSGRACSIDVARQMAAEKEIEKLTERFNNLQGNVRVKVQYVEEDLKKVQDELKSLTPTVDAQGRNPTLSGPIEHQLDDLKDRQMYFQDQLRQARQEVASQVAECQQIQARIQELQAQLPNIQAEIDAAKQQHELAMKSFDYQMRQVEKYEDMTQGTVDALRRDEWVAQAKVDTVTARVRGDMASEIAAQQAQLQREEADAALKEAYLNSLREEAERAAAQASTTKAGDDGSVLSLVGHGIAHPVETLLKLISIGQSPEEIAEILRSGQENIKLLRSQAGAVDRAADAEHTEAHRLRSELDECVRANQGTPPDDSCDSGDSEPPDSPDAGSADSRDSGNS